MLMVLVYSEAENVILGQEQTTGAWGQQEAVGALDGGTSHSSTLVMNFKKSS